MKDLIVRILFKADDKAVKSQLKKTEQEAKKSANNISGSFKKAFGGLATSLAGLGLARIFKSAIDDAAKLEQSLLKLQTAAKNTGQDFNTIREGLQRLRSEGVLSFQVITEASAQLLQQGFSADQVEPFLRALRNIGALENTVGDTNLAIQSFIRAISTNSLELVDNLSPALRKAVLDLGGFNEIAKDAAKQQELFNITLERGNRLAPAFAESVGTLAGKQEQFATNTEKLSESFGQVLIPAFEVFLGIGSDIVVGLTNAINGFSSLERALLAASSAATALGVTLAVLAGPYVALGAAATAFLAVLVASRQELNEVNDLVDDTGGKVKDLEKKLINLDKVKSSDSQKALLIEELKTATNNYNNALIKRIELERNVNLSTVEALKTEKERITFQRTQALNILQAGSSVGFNKEQQRILSQGSVAQVKKLTGKIKAGQVKGFSGGFTVEEIGALDLLPLLAQETTAVSTALNTATLASKKYNQALNDAKGGTDGASQGARGFSEEAVKVGETVFPTLTEALIDMAGRLDTAAYNVDTITGAVEVLGDESASASDKIRGLGEGLRGIGGLFSQLGAAGAGAGLGVAGAGLGLVGAVGGLFESLFSRQTNETNSLLDQQLELQREQYNLQRQQAQVEDKYFQDRLEIIRLEAREKGEDPNKAIAAAISQELKERFEFTGQVSTESLRAQRETIKQLGERSVQAQGALLSIQGMSDLDKFTGLRLIANQFGVDLGSLTRISDIESRIVQELSRIISGEELERAKKIQDLLQQGITAGIAAGGIQEETEAQKIRQDIAKKEQDLQELIIEQNRGINRKTEIQALQSDIDRLRALLILPEKPPGDDAPTTLQRVQPSGFSFLDISRGGLQTALGFAPSRAVQMISGAGVPGQIGSLTVATEAMKTTEEKMLDTLDGQLSELKKQTDILSKLTGQDVTIAVLNAISAGQARSI